MNPRFSADRGTVDFDTIAQVLSAAAAVAALGISTKTYFKQQVMERNSYLILRLDLKQPERHELLIQTCLENRSVHAKTFTHVILLICPFDELPGEAFNALTRYEDAGIVTELEDFPHRLDEVEGPICSAQRMLIPLDYYTKENSEVADEILTFDVPLDISQLDVGRAYSVRFVLYGPERLHRVVQRAFVR